MNMMSELHKKKSIPRFAIVTNWFGPELTGGAEQQAWQIATRMAQADTKVEVLTTCSRSFHHSWDHNYYKPGSSLTENLRIRRFAVDKRNKKAFDRVVGRMLSLDIRDQSVGISPISASEERTYLDHNICSQDLLDYLSQHLAEYDQVLFMPYLFPLAIKGVAIAKHKSLLQPCLHDEIYAYLPSVREAFEQCSRVLLNSRGEELLTKRLMGDWIANKCQVIGEGVEVEDDLMVTPDVPLIDGPYVLCLGKRCVEKGTDLLIAGFDRFAKIHKDRWRLVLAGPDSLPLTPISDRVIDMGLVDAKTKTNLLAHCQILANVSINESFSRVIFEAWYHHKPVMVHRDCLATYTAMNDAGGAGWAISNIKDIQDLLEHLLTISSDEYSRRGELGYDFARKNADWNGVVERYKEVFIEASPAKNLSLRAMLVTNHQGFEHLAKVAAYARCLKRAKVEVFVLSPSPISEGNLAHLQCNQELLNSSFDYYFWFEGCDWPMAWKAIEHAHGKKIFVSQQSGNTAEHSFFHQKISSSEAVPLHWEEKYTAPLTVDFSVFHHCNTPTINLAFFCSTFAQDSMEYITSIKEVANDLGVGKINIMVFCLDSQLNPLPNQRHVLKIVKVDLLPQIDFDSYLMANDVICCFEPNPSWRSLLAIERSGLPAIFVSDSRSFSEGVHYTPVEKQEIIQAIVAIVSSQEVRSRIVDSLRNDDIFSHFKGAIYNHIDICLGEIRQEPIS